MSLIRLSFKSLLNRKLSAVLSMLAVTFSTTLVLSIERIKQGAENSFAGVITGADFIVGAPGSPLNTLLYSVFHMGESIKNINYETFQQVSADPRVAWTIPISLGDSHRGFRVVATSDNFFKHYQYRNQSKLSFRSGSAWNSNSSPNQVVIGIDVATSEKYQVGDKIILTHGLESLGDSSDHSNNPFEIVGVLSKTGTPVDRGVYITLTGMEVIHQGFESGIGPGFFGAPSSAPSPNENTSVQIKSITSFIVGLQDRRSVFHMARSIPADFNEPLMAVIPGITLSKLWQNLSVFETSLKALAFIVVVTGFLGVAISLLTSLNERRREMAILRSLGASPKTIFSLLIAESQILTFSGLALGFFTTYLTLFLGAEWIENQYGLSIPVVLGYQSEFIYAGFILFVGFLTSLIPAFFAARNSVNDGLSQRML